MVGDGGAGDDDRKAQPLASLTFGVCGALGVAAIAGSIEPIAGGPGDVGSWIRGVAISAGTPVIGQVDNHVVPGPSAVVGVLLLAATAISGWSLWRLAPADREPLNEAVGFIVLGCFSIAAVAWGRIGFGADYLAAPRYAIIALPLAIGLYLFWSLARVPAARVMFPTIAAILLSGQIVTNVEESRMAVHRAHFMRDTHRLIRCHGASDPALRSRTAANRWDAMASGMEFLASKRVLVFEALFDCSDGRSRGEADPLDQTVALGGVK